MKTNIVTADRYLTIRCKAFAGGKTQSHRLLVKADSTVGNEVTRGAILVYDDSTKDFTSRHALSPSTIRRIRRTFQP